jgi:hypothetical protein
MNCGICVAWFGYTMSGRRRKHPCSGCRSRKTHCAFLKQHCDALATQRVHYCFECTEFPCERLTTLDRRYRDKYGMSVIENLRHIQRNGIAQFLTDEQDKWECPTCGGMKCVHTNRCYTCQPL